MNKDLQAVLNLIQQSERLSDEEKKSMSKSLKDADKELEITSFKLDRTEKVKRTTAILLEETIEELEQKRKAVEAQNHELEIESSLERVRTVAMSMNRPDDMLHVCQTIAEQLDLLKVKEIRNVQTAIFYQEKGAYMNYEYYAKHNKTFITETNYTGHEIHQDFANRMLKGNGEFMVAHIEGDEVKAWLDYQKTTNVFIDDYLNTASSLNYYWFSLGPVALGISTYVPLTEEEINLFKRFLKVFELSYRRYLDIEKAEAQAYEAKVEASLEKVRAVAMSMNKPDDLLNICETLYKEFTAFGFADLRNAMINIHNDENKTFVNYDYSDEIGKSTNHLQYDLHPVIKKQIKQIRTANDAFSETVFTGKDLTEWKKFRKKIGEKNDPRIKKAKALYYYFYSIGTGSIGISTFSPVNEKNLKLLKRFRNVFNLSYQRYTDLALAEAQAKEAKIEASLERMRAAAMSMRKSEELISVCEAMYKELTVLGFANIRNAQIAIKSESRLSYFISEYSDHAVIVMKEAPYNSSPLVKVLYEEMENSKDALYQKEFSGKEFDEWRAWRKNVGAAIDNRIEQANSMCFYLYSFSKGYLGISTFNAITKDQLEILKRFKNVFELSYTRYIDVAQAEAQAKEAQIELALERVRARTMAMQKSDELSETVFILFQQFKQLGENPDQATIGIINEDEWVIEYWVTMYGNQTNRVYKFPIDEPNVTNRIYKAWKEQKKSLVIELSGKELYDFANFRESMGGAAYNAEEKKRVINVAFFSKGLLNVQSNESRSAESILLLERFAGVFEQTYTRFLDLQKAEAQARESQIQLALERVRARTMAMQKSEELPDAANLLFQQMQALGMPAWSAGYCIWDKNKQGITLWMSSEGVMQPSFHAPLTDDPSFIHFREAYERGESFHVEAVGGDELVSHYKYMRTLPGIGEILDSIINTGHPLPTFQIFHCAYFSQGFLLFITYEPIPEAHDIFKRFGKVFDQTYTRFLDLKKAEAQAREAKIEAALERVRSRSMAMQKSEELKEVIQVVYDQFVHLNIQVEHTGFIMDYKERDDMHIWLADMHEVPSEVSIPYFDSPHWNSFIKAKENGEDFFANLLNFEEKNKFYHDLFQLIPGIPDETRNYYLSCAGLAGSTVLLDNVGLYIENFSGTPYTDEENAVLMRFGKVFQQTYTRFLDLQKAEAQAREAQIEAALERVRSRSMGMQKSEELRDVIQVIFEQLIYLNFKLNGAGFMMDYRESDDFNFWFANSSSTFPIKVHIPYLDHPEFNRFKEAKQKGLNLFVNTLTFEEKNKFFDHFFKYTGSFPEELKQLVYNAPGYCTSHVFLKNVILFVNNFSDDPFSDAENATLMRFGKVFEQTYTRFTDLKNAEAQALEAIKRASVDRVRAEIASMRTTNDLERITPLIWNELTVLGIPFIRCGVFIMDEEQKKVQTFLYTEGKTIASFTSTYSNSRIIIEALPYWRRKEIYKTHWDEAAFLEQAKSLVEQGSITSGEKYLTEHRPTDLYLHFLPFLQGMLYVGDAASLSEEHLQSVQALAEAFSTAYARYEDFNKLEAAKQQVDKTLVDLKQTQAQLVQSEKMASLGELTAGIAHEIQNPLNFVNNFSEVNKELLAELNEEIEKGNYEEVKMLASDVISNEEKINHHGKRADAIVKGMLQHSRSSTNVKEPTDINKLADEYLRLAYHGLRAKDKSFNAELKTDYDESIGKINIVPQDIGRAVLNLITNAFYAVTEKQKLFGKEMTSFEKMSSLYEPTVTVSTKKSGNQVSITVSDNGNGIPQKIVDKIFQPFFTTKPTGQGTGLGLSLSYDIIKAHGGEIKVETMQGEESKFIIQLPVA